MVGNEQITTVSGGLLVRAPAKINLSLLIASKRPDGFHEIETVMAKVNFFDEILIQPGKRKGIELICKGPAWAPEGKENLVYKACEMLIESCSSKADIKITLTKNVPAGAGLGSASSDAAATLIGVNELLKSGLGHKELSEMAAALGSDVAFFLGGPLAFCSGKGEKIKKIYEIFNFLAILVLPDITVSTKKVYANYKHDPALYEKLNTRIIGYLQKNRIDLLLAMYANMLEISCFRLYKELAELKATIEALDIRPLGLSGSGSAMFCIIDNGDMERAGGYKCKLEEKLRCRSIIVHNNKW
jgi:4-diphosphocytidyl-2-C-methyl-D-erythritol kinase